MGSGTWPPDKSDTDGTPIHSLIVQRASAAGGTGIWRSAAAPFTMLALEQRFQTFEGWRAPAIGARCSRPPCYAESDISFTLAITLDGWA
jgi:hypothetical protein